MTNPQPLFIGNHKALFSSSKIEGSFCNMGDEAYYKIENVDQMPPFFMSIVSNANHWMFISSNGALTAGRKNADFALFPYYTDDKITESHEITGCKTLFHINKKGKSYLWEPFSDRYEGVYAICRNLYINSYGNKILFEEINHDLKVSFRYQWSSSMRFGFVRQSSLINLSKECLSFEYVDGLQNIMPSGVESNLQNATSNLVDAYKRSEILKPSGIGIFALSAIIVDKAEPSEALKASIVWSLGVEKPHYLLSSQQLSSFRKGMALREESDVKGEKGAYFIFGDGELAANQEKTWMIVANVNQSHSDIASLTHEIANGTALQKVLLEDIDAGTRQLVQYVASSDGLQCTCDKLKNARHFSNTLFNIMRGGIFENNYQVEKKDVTSYLFRANNDVFYEYKGVIGALEDRFPIDKLHQIAHASKDADFERLCYEYLPLTFSRRHGDPSRPWNRFSINTQSEVDGSKVLDYEGNWRDIFQNWEALSISFPDYLEGMIFKFLNATTFDGYNPYRIMKNGIDWEILDPDNPWSYIGYWGDHQIIYLLKLLERLEDKQAGKIADYFEKELFVYANVPYKIKSYEQILANSKDTIDFDTQSNANIFEKRLSFGADAALLTDAQDHIYHVNMMEKILATLLAKMSNFIPEGGIWMDTQRPEWNDANNALVGNGVSMVTLYYLRRFLHFFYAVLAAAPSKEVAISKELALCFSRMLKTLEAHVGLLAGPINDKERKQVTDGLAKPASEYRKTIYRKSFSGQKTRLGKNRLLHFMELCQQYVEHSIRANKRQDKLFHSYNIMSVVDNEAISLSHLSEMLEGQVGVLSSGYLSAQESIDLLESLRKSDLYRADQNSYLLYPNKYLPKFSEKNTISSQLIQKSDLLKALLEKGNKQIVEKDVNGCYHFNGNLHNANDLQWALEQVRGFNDLRKKDFGLVLEIFEECFNHKAFTGRSGTFFAYEGLGSIYWHMVSKLQLAVLECCEKARKESADKETINRLSDIYNDIREGIGVHKSPDVYGAFPFDPYSHSPFGKGVKQPGMTGQVKEDILCRFGEFGVLTSNGQVHFDPFLLREAEWLTKPQTFDYIDVTGNKKSVRLAKNSLCFTLCQVPIIYQKDTNERIEIKLTNGKSMKINGTALSKELSKMIFNRNAEVENIHVFLNC